VAFNDILGLLKEAFPFTKLPKNFQEAKSIVRDLGLDYKKIHACLMIACCIRRNMRRKTFVVNAKFQGGNLIMFQLRS